MRDLFTDAWPSRLLRLATPPRRNQDLRPLLDHPAVGPWRWVGWDEPIRGVPPSMAYRDEGKDGVWAGLLQARRVTVRAAEVLGVAKREASSRTGTAWAGLHRTEQDRLKAKVEEELRAMQAPVVRHVPVLLVDDWIWVCGDDPSFDSDLGRIVTQTLGVWTMHPGAWDAYEGQWGWNAGARVLLRHTLDPGSSGISLLSVDARSGAVRIQVKSQVRRQLDAIRALVHAPNLEVRAVQVQVERGGRAVQISLDPEGVSAVNAPPSRGGLAPIRIRRRHEDVMWGLEVLRTAWRSLRQS